MEGVCESPLFRAKTSTRHFAHKPSSNTTIILFIYRKVNNRTFPQVGCINKLAYYLYILYNKRMKEIQISDILLIRLQDYGIIKWHKNDNHSFYLKFKDVRLGSIRIANHKGRERYHYTYEIFKSDKDIHRKIEDIVESIKQKSLTLKNFTPLKWIVWDKENHTYKEVKDFQEYKDAIWSK